MVQVPEEQCCSMNGSFGFPAVWQAFSPYRGWLALAWGPAYIQLAHHQTPCGLPSFCQEFPTMATLLSGTDRAGSVEEEKRSC